MKKISKHEIAVFNAIKDGKWRTALETSAVAKVGARTANRHLASFAVDGLAEVRQSFPAYEYRLKKGKLSRVAAAREKVLRGYVG
jgi:hypothetical protein